VGHKEPALKKNNIKKSFEMSFEIGHKGELRQINGIFKTYAKSELFEALPEI